MKCSKIIASKVKLAQSVQDRTEQEQTRTLQVERIIWIKTWMSEIHKAFDYLKEHEVSDKK